MDTLTIDHRPAAQADLAARHWIDGSWRSSSAVGVSVSPVDGRVLGSYADGGIDEAQAAIAAARRAFDTTQWGRDRALRARALLELADRLEERAEEIAVMLARENGKLLREAQLEATMSPSNLRNAAATVLARTGGQAAEVAPGVYYHSLVEPIGVAGIIVPWNSPVQLLVRSLAPALAAGCTVAVKMPTQTALVNGLVYEAVAATTSLPAGVVNLFTESGNGGAPALVASPDVDVISYTGSTAVGRTIAAQAAPSLKRLNLELGGKTPLLVFADADLDAIVPTLVSALTVMTGQFCMTGSRVLVQASIADQLRERLSAAIENVNVGPSEDPASDMGAMIDQRNVDRVDRIVSDAAEYATVLVRGGPAREGVLADGAFYRPSLVEVRDVQSPLVQREVFGPVQTFEVFADESDAIARANATEYGLAAAVFTRDVDRARRVGRELRAGTVWTNTWAQVHDLFEEGGVKQSGVGRLRGARGVEEFEEIKTYVQIAPASA